MSEAEQESTNLERGGKEPAGPSGNPRSEGGEVFNPGTEVVNINEPELETSEEKLLATPQHHNIHLPQNVELRRDIEKLFVNNLPKEADEGKLEKLFAKYGQVVSVVIPETVSKRRAEYAIVEMENYRAAEEAMKFLSGSEFEGKRITVTPALTNDEFRKPS